MSARAGTLVCLTPVSWRLFRSYVAWLLLLAGAWFVRQLLVNEHVATVVRMRGKLAASGQGAAGLSLLWVGIGLPGSAQPDWLFSPPEFDNSPLG